MARAHFEAGLPDQNYNSGRDVSRSTAETEQTTENPESDSCNDLRFNFDSHKPLSYTKSVPSFLGERIHHLQLGEGRRSRSHSEPLTREALKIAQELRKASDLFNTNYEAFSPVRKEFVIRRRDKSRRITLGGSGGESLRQEVHQALQANKDNFPGYNPIPPEGTPV